MSTLKSTLHFRQADGMVRGLPLRKTVASLLKSKSRQGMAAMTHPVYTTSHRAPILPSDPVALPSRSPHPTSVSGECSCPDLEGTLEVTLSLFCHP